MIEDFFISRISDRCDLILIKAGLPISIKELNNPSEGTKPLRGLAAALKE